LQINSVIDEHVRYARLGLDDGVWEAIHEEGEMRVYKREMEEDGMIVDPLKAVHQVQVRAARGRHTSLQRRLS